MYHRQAIEAEVSRLPAKSLAASSATARDSRADDAARCVGIDGQNVSIRRRYKGIDMHLAVPVTAYRGVALVGAEGGREVRLVHRDPDLSITLCLAESDQDGVAERQSWAQFLALPAIDDSDLDRVLQMLAQLGRETRSPQTARRQGSAVTKRRPRFLVRRKRGRLERLAIVHRDEREIIAYE